MNEDKTKNSIEEKIIGKIKSGEVKMKPKIYFIAVTALITLGILITIGFALFITSFIIFSLHSSGSWFLPRFGTKGIGAFFMEMPWFLVILASLFIILTYFFGRRFSFAYRNPLIYFAAIILVAVVAGSFIVAKTPLHKGLYLRAQNKYPMMPMVGQFYKDYGPKKPDQVHFGVVLDQNENGFKIKTPNNEEVQIIVTDDTHFVFDNDINVGDSIMVGGENVSSTIEAFGIRKISSDEDENFIYSPHGMQMRRWR